MTNNKKEFTMDKMNVDDDGNIEFKGTHVVYNLDGEKTANEWAKEEVKGLKLTEEVILMTTALNIDARPKSNKIGKLVKGALGSCMLGRNSIGSNAQATILFSTKYTDGGFSILESNYRKVMSIYAARKLKLETWYNGTDGYYVPNINHPDYEQYNNDAIIYSIFYKSTYFTSIRNARADNRLWNVENKFFYTGIEEMIKGAKACKYQDLIDDATNYKDGFIYNKLKTFNLTNTSLDALEILDMARELTLEGIPYRKEMNKVDTEQGAERNLQCWDAGWFQNRIILKEKLPDKLKIFDEKFEEFEKRMRDSVYEFGFLKR